MDNIFYKCGDYEKPIGYATTQTEVYSFIKEYLDNIKYKSYYTRSWKDNDNIWWYDVGSWSEFIIWKGEIE